MKERIGNFQHQQTNCSISNSSSLDDTECHEMEEVYVIQKKDQELEEIRRNHPDATFSVGHNVFSDRTVEEIWKRLSILPEPVHSL